MFSVHFYEQFHNSANGSKIAIQLESILGKKLHFTLSEIYRSTKGDSLEWPRS